MHRVWIQSIPKEPGEIVVDGEEARHSIRVKRVRVREAIEALDGRGGVGSGVVVEIDEGGKKRDGRLVVRLDAVRLVEPTRPRVEVWTAVAKGGRVDEMVDQLSQAGAAAWRALHAARSVAGAGEHKLERLERIAREAAKQCGRAWVMEIGQAASTPIPPTAEAARGAADELVVICEGSGPVWRPEMMKGLERVRLLVGPEGGWTPEELEMCRDAGAVAARFGPHVMRIETAAVVACGVVMAEMSSA